MGPGTFDLKPQRKHKCKQKQNRTTAHNVNERKERRMMIKNKDDDEYDVQDVE